MKTHTRINAAAAAVLLLAFTSAVSAQLTDLPNLSTAQTTGKTSATSATSNGKTTEGTSATTGGTSVTTGGTSATSAATTDGTTTAATSASSGSTTGTATSSNSIFHLSDVPTIAGAGIPTMVVPFTADAPFMQKSDLPEGTVFIVVGAVLGFLGFCVLAWRGLVAWSINRSVKKAALASMMASDTKTPGGWINNPLSKPSRGFYSHAPDGSSLSLDHLTASGKPMNKDRASRMAPCDASGLFFSPTATNAPGSAPMAGLPGNRSSSYLPAGYYASPSSQLAGGAQNTTLGAGFASPRRSRIETSPPTSPAVNPRRSNARLSTVPGLQLPQSREGSRGPSRPTSTMLPHTASGLHTQPSSSSLGVNLGHGEDLPGSRAPSAYLEDLFEEHGNGPRERF